VKVSRYVVHTVIFFKEKSLLRSKESQIISIIDARRDVNENIHLATLDRCVRISIRLAF
jgi:hypothetical protein